MTYGPFAVSHCQRCASELTYLEYKAMAWYCGKCQAAIDDQKHRDQLAEQINKANKRVGK